MHVLTLVPSLRMGGAEIQALRNCEALRRAGYRVTLVTIFRPEGDFFAPHLARLVAAGVTHRALLDRPVSLVPRGPAHFLAVLARAALRLRRVYREDAPDVVYTRLWYASLLAWATGAVTRRRPRLVFNEESRLRATGLKERLRLFLLRRAGAWLVPCRGLRDEAVALGVPAASGAVLPNVVDGHPSVGLAAREPGPLRLGFLGRLEPAKGLDRLLDVAAGLLAAGRPFTLTIGGGGSLDAWVRAAVAARGLPVTLTGPVADVDGFLAGLDMLLLTSRYEGFANVIVEANAQGVPVLAMRVPHGPADVVREGLNGFLVPDGDVAAMVGFLDELDVGWLATMAPACRAIAAEYGLDAQSARWRAILEGTRCAS